MDEDRRRAFIVEINWTGRPVGAGVLDDLGRRASLDPVLGSLERTCAVVSRSGFRGRHGPKDRRYLVRADDLLGR